MGRLLNQEMTQAMGDPFPAILHSAFCLLHSLRGGFGVALRWPYGGFGVACGSQSPPNQLALRWLYCGFPWLARLFLILHSSFSILHSLSVAPVSP